MRILCGLILLALGAQASHATPIHVPADQPTIQAGIDAASAGDTVLIACGTYYEHDLVLSVGITLRSEDGDPGCVTIDANKLGRVFSASYAGTLRLEGLTLTGGLAEDGGAVSATNTNLAIDSCRFLANESIGQGGAVYIYTIDIYSWQSSVENSYFDGNSATDNGGAVGAITARSSLTLNFSDSEFRNNDSGIGGGAIWAMGSSSSSWPHDAFLDIIVDECRFWNNEAVSEGGGIWAQSVSSTSFGPSECTVTVHGSIFGNNTAASGGGFACGSMSPNSWDYSRCIATISSSTFWSNTAATGGAAYALEGLSSNPCTMDIVDCIISGSPAGSGVSRSGGADIQASCTDFHGNIPGAFGGGIPDQVGTQGNIDADPLFCDAEEESLHLDVDSPCLPGGNACNLLMGALGEGECYHVVLDPLGTGTYPDIQSALNAMESGTIYLTDGVYAGPGNRDLNFLGKPLTLRSLSDDPENCIIDCGGSADEPHRAFFFMLGESGATRIENLTVRNGWAEQGGALACLGSASPGILGCRLESCGALVGGAVFVNSSSAPVFETTLFLGNEAEQVGGAIYCENASVELRNCTLVGNGSGSMFAAGIFGLNSAATVESSLIAYNGPGEAILWLTGAIDINCSDLYGNIDGDWVGGIEEQLGVDGNFTAHPRFCNLPGGVLTLGSNSPCLPDNNSCGVQIGAYGQGCDVVAAGELPADGPAIVLHAAYPNPFNPQTKISFELQSPTVVSMTVYDLSGRLVRELLTAKETIEGHHEVEWNGLDTRGKPVSSGVYFYRLNAGPHSASGRMVLLK